MPCGWEGNRRSDVALAIRYDTIQYNTRCYFKVRLKADMSQLNLPHGTKKWKTENLTVKKRICSEVSVNSPGNPCSQSMLKRYQWFIQLRVHGLYGREMSLHSSWGMAHFTFTDI